MTNAVLIFLAGGFGSVLRYLVGLAVPSALFPWATLGVNSVVLSSGFSARWRHDSAGARA